MYDHTDPASPSTALITRTRAAVLGLLVLLVIGAAYIDITATALVVGGILIAPLIAMGIERDLKRAARLFPH